MGPFGRARAGVEPYGGVVIVLPSIGERTGVPRRSANLAAHSRLSPNLARRSRFPGLVDRISDLAGATAAGTRAQEELKRHGIELSEVRVGDPDPVEAAADEWNERPDYDEVILSTLTARASRWLRGDARNRLANRLAIPVRHVVAEPRQ